MKKTLIVVVILCGISFWVVTSDREAKHQISIGWIGVLTGEAASYGIAVKQGTELAVDEINQSNFLDGHQLRITYEDDKADPKTGVNIMNHYIHNIRPVAIVQAAASSVMLANIPLAQKNKVVYISPTCSNDKIKDGGEYIFRIWPSDSYQGKFIARYIYEKMGIREAATLYINNDFGTGLNLTFVEEFEQLGGRIVSQETFFPGATNMRTQLENIKKSNAQIVFIPSHIKETKQVLKEAIELNLGLPFFADAASFSSDLLEMKNDIYVVNLELNTSGNSNEVKDFVQKFKDRYGETPDIYAAAGYDSIYTLAWGLRLSKEKTSENLKNTLHSVNFEGVTGNISFDNFGEIQKEYVVYRVEGGDFKWWQQ